MSGFRIFRKIIHRDGLNIKAHEFLALTIVQYNQLVMHFLGKGVLYSLGNYDLNIPKLQCLQSLCVHVVAMNIRYQDKVRFFHSAKSLSSSGRICIEDNISPFDHRGGMGDRCDLNTICILFYFIGCFGNCTFFKFSIFVLGFIFTTGKESAQHHHHN